jgi:hypothetical protein
MKSPASARSFNTAALFSLLAALAVGCQKEEAPPPLPTAKPVEAPAVATIVPEDEEEEETTEATTTDAPKKGGKGGGSTLSKCCSALRQNAANAPPETKAQMEQAAAACDAANKAGASSALSIIGRFGVKLPPVCQ